MSSSQDIREGLAACLPTSFAIAPFSLLFGAVAVDVGLTPGEAVLMSATIFAGAGQMVGIELFGQNIAPWMVVVSILAVNFRMVFYSAAMTPHVARWSFGNKLAAFFFLTDVHYTETERRSQVGRPITFAWYLGFGLPLYALWILLTWIGTEFGRLIEDPHAFGIDFLITLYFLGVMLGFRKRRLWIGIVTVSALASVLAHETIGSPWHLTIGAVAGIVAAMLVSRRRLPVRADV